MGSYSHSFSMHHHIYCMAILQSPRGYHYNIIWLSINTYSFWLDEVSPERGDFGPRGSREEVWYPSNIKTTGNMCPQDIVGVISVLGMDSAV